MVLRALLTSIMTTTVPTIYQNSMYPLWSSRKVSKARYIIRNVANYQSDTWHLRPRNFPGCSLHLLPFTLPGCSRNPVRLPSITRHSVPVRTTARDTVLGSYRRQSSGTCQIGTSSMFSPMFHLSYWLYGTRAFHDLCSCNSYLSFRYQRR